MHIHVYAPPIVLVTLGRGQRVDTFHSSMPDHVRGMTPRSGKFPYSPHILLTKRHSARDLSQTIATKDLFRSGPAAGRVLAPNGR